jgi:spore coat protein A
MRMNRRDFVKSSVMVGTGLYLWGGKLFAYSQSPLLRKFITPLPGLGPTGIPLAAPNQSIYPGVDFYTIRIGAYTQQFHPDLPGESHLWGYADITNGGAPNHRYLGGFIIANRGTPVRVNFVNNLPRTHPLSVDKSIPAAGLIPGTRKFFSENRTAVHLHGGFIPWVSDGGPFSWFDAQGNEGLSRVAWLPVGPNDPRYTGNPRKNLSKDYWWPNAQSARLMWYHDHAVGITRLNAYAGIATGYVLLDQPEKDLIAAGAIPGLDRVVPLILQDKTFIGPNGNPDGGRGGPGDLWYPNLYEKGEAGPSGRWDWGGGNEPPNPSCVPEFFADTPVINGMAYPYVQLEPRRYRFLFLNGSQARFYNLQLYFAQSNRLSNPLCGEPDLKHAKGAGIPAFIQIATEGGFLPAPVIFPNNPPARIGFENDPSSPTFGNATRYNLLLGPAERADVIIDFSKVKPGSVLILYSDAPAPFPGGDPRNDYFTGDPDYTNPASNPDGLSGGAPTTRVGKGPNTRTLMQIRIGPLVGAPDPPFVFPTLPGLDPAPLVTPGTVPPWVSDHHLKNSRRQDIDVVRDLTLNEFFDSYGRLIQLLGTTEPTGAAPDGTKLYGREYFDPATLLSTALQNPKVGAVEVWRIFNTTGDTHPMHFHLGNFQVLSRQPFDLNTFNVTGQILFAGPARPADPNELSWKETIRMNPGECVTLITQFNLPPDPVVNGKPVTVPFSPRFLVMGVKGYEYVWHCHILEHEEHDMMQPLLVRP